MTPEARAETLWDFTSEGSRYVVGEEHRLETTTQQIAEVIREAEDEAWNDGLLRAVKVLEDSMNALGALMSVGVDLREEQAWGRGMVFAIKDHLGKIER